MNWQDIDKKIFASLEAIQSYWRQQEGISVWTNGCFDLIHLGHLISLRKAKALGDHLIVGLNSDQSVRTLKGNTRPIMPQQYRARYLAALSVVDAVLLFDEIAPLTQLQNLQPHIFAKGADYDINTLPEARIVKQYGGRTVTLPLVDDVSTTLIMKKLKKR